MNALIIEDDGFLANRLKIFLKKNKSINKVHVIFSYATYLWEAHTLSHYDIVLVDIMLWKENAEKTGIDIIKHIRQKNYSIPIIVLSGLSHISWLQKAFDAWANDYLVKPFRIEELEIRVQRWYQNHICSLITIPNPKIFYYEITFDIQANAFFFWNEQLNLTKTHKYIFSIFLSLIEKPISEEYLKEKVWGDRSWRVDRNIRIHIFRLKKRLGEFGIGLWIRNIRGEWYMLKKPA